MSEQVEALVSPTPPTLAPVGATAERERGLWRDALRETLRKPSAIVGLVLLSFLVVLAVFAPLIAPYSPTEDFLDEGLRPRADPSAEHWLGLDGNGRDELSRLIYGARISLLAGIGSVTMAVLIGAALGLIAGFYGRTVDNVTMRVMDVLLAFPSLLLAITIVTVLGKGLFNAVLAISVVTIPIYARVVRASALSIREQEFVAADRALGVPSRRILVHRVLPNCLTPLVVQATLGIATAVLEIAALSFLGLGVQAPQAEWGSMLAAERNQLLSAPHLVIFPGLMIMINVLAFNLIGDGLRDALDPRLNR